jgi:hypothetical protein
MDLRSQSDRRPAAVEGVVEQRTDALAGERGRVRVGALEGEVGGAIEVSLAQADLGQALLGAERGGEVEQPPAASSASSAREPGMAAGAPARL